MKTVLCTVGIGLLGFWMGCGQKSQGIGLDASTTAGSMSASASAKTQVSATSTVKIWVGSYAAKKAVIEPPEKVKDVTWKKDTGEKAVGPGTLTISATLAGSVTGFANGVFGEQTISGVIEGKNLRFSIYPKTGSSAEGLTGTGIGEANAAGYSGTMRCSNPDAVIVREANFEIKPQ